MYVCICICIKNLIYIQTNFNTIPYQCTIKFAALEISYISLLTLEHVNIIYMYMVWSEVDFTPVLSGAVPT